MTSANIRIAMALTAVSVMIPLASAQSLIARAVNVTGQAILTPATGGPAFSLTAGYSLNYSDWIDTTAGGRVVIAISDGSVVVVQPGTRLMMKDFRAAESLRELFEITVGIVRVKINHFAGKPNPYRMNSPTASIAVRGTEFNVTVRDTGETSVDVLEGAVEVSSRTDPSRHMVVEGGSGVLVQPGGDFRSYKLQGGTLIGSQQMESPDRDHHDVAGKAPATPPRNADTTPHAPDQVAQNSPPPQHGGPGDGGGPHDAGQGGSMQPHTTDPGHDAPADSTQPKVAALSTYDRYLGTLTAVAELPFSNLYTAFADPYVDAADNPAYATGFRSAEGQFFLTPIWSGTTVSSASGTGAVSSRTFTVAPLVSAYTPLAGGKYVIGGSFASYRAGTNSTGAQTGSADLNTRFSTGAITFADRLTTKDSVGLGVERLFGSGDDGTAGNSGVGQTRVTLGYTREFSSSLKLGFDYRRGWLNADNHQAAGFTSAFSGNSNEVGVRARGNITPKLFYGAALMWSESSLGEMLHVADDPGVNRDLSIHRASLVLGAGYALTRDTFLNLDLSVARARLDSTDKFEQSLGIDHVASLHFAVQRNVTRRMFAHASYLGIKRTWHGSTALLTNEPNPPGVNSVFTPFTATLYPRGGSFSVFGAGWRFSPQVTFEYVYSTDYGVTSGMHALVFRYVFRSHRD